MIWIFPFIDFGYWFSLDLDWFFWNWYPFVLIQRWFRVGAKRNLFDKGHPPSDERKIHPVKGKPGFRLLMNKKKGSYKASLRSYYKSIFYTNLINTSMVI